MARTEGELPMSGDVRAAKVSADELKEARREGRAMQHGATWVSVRYDGDTLRASIHGSRAYGNGRQATASVEITEGTTALVQALDDLLEAHQESVEEATFDAAVESRLVAKRAGELG